VKIAKTADSIFTPCVSSICPFFKVLRDDKRGTTVMTRRRLSIAKHAALSLTPVSRVPWQELDSPLAFWTHLT